MTAIASDAPPATRAGLSQRSGAAAARPEAPISALRVSAFRVPTDRPESDGTLSWDHTTLVTVEIEAGGERGLGYTYASAAAARLIEDALAGAVLGGDPAAVAGLSETMVRAVRNLGRPGVASTAIAAVDVALWDLKAKLLGVSLAGLLGPVRERVAVYGSGGFTSYDGDELREQLAGWAAEGIRAAKIKVGRRPEDDPRRVELARSAVGYGVELMVDANGAYDRKQALAMAEAFAGWGVSWFEEPVSSDDLEGLRLLRDRAPAGIEIAAGEYGWDRFDFRRLLEAGAVDVLQADATRCAGVTGFLEAAALCRAFSVPLSSHTAPALHAPLVACAAAGRHVEWFHDHVRLERLAFDGAPVLDGGDLVPDLGRPGLGLELKRADLADHLVYDGGTR